MSITLPLATQGIRCSDFAKVNEVDPGGTALAPDVVVLVEVSEPWPKPVGKHDDLRPLVAVAQGHPEQVRLLAAVPHDPDAPRAIAFRPSPEGMARSEALLGTDPVSALGSVLANEDGVEVHASTGPRTMLICTQGSHDVCCGVIGEDFAKTIEDRRTDVEVFRVSHTGGHRFSPTAMTLPDGRMWAFLTTELTDAIIDRDDAVPVAAHCRGWWGAPTGPAQIAERAVFAELGFAVDSQARVLEVAETASGSEVSVTVDGATYDVLVTPGREVPTIACEAPGGQPVKPGREWLVAAGPERR